MERLEREGVESVDWDLGGRWKRLWLDGVGSGAGVGGRLTSMTPELWRGGFVMWESGRRVVCTRAFW